MMSCAKCAAIFILVVAINQAASQGDTFSNCHNEIGTINCPTDAKYRRFDGRCNNLANPTWGAMNTKILRLIEAQYADSDGTPRGFGIRPDIPPPNQVAIALFQANNNDDRSVWTALFMTFGQFLDHDMTLATHLSSRDCKITNCASASSFNYPCFPIKFARDTDQCTPLSRAIPVCRGSGGTSRDQINELTAFVDASHIYGNTEDISKKLRTEDGGKLKLKNNLLPLDSSIRPCRIRGGCSLVGDERGDENIALHAMHTLWVREHNRIATELKRLHSDWTEEKLFQTARKINTAQYQHIVFTEYVPIVVGLSKYSGYKSNVNPSIANGFATAAFRYGHSLIPNEFSQLDSGFNKKFEPIELRDAFETRQTIDARGIEPTMFGLIDKLSNNVDNGFAFGVARRLMEPSGQDTHRDLTAFNIQRGRDHGIPTYGKWRDFCGLDRVKSFDEFDKGPSVKKAFDELGQSIDDLDLFAGGILEKRPSGTTVGATFECIIKNQFERLRDGDRFYYEASGVFKRHELLALRRVTLARIMCDNLDGIVSVQREIFRKKRPIECGRIPSMNLAVFG